MNVNVNYSKYNTNITKATLPMHLAGNQLELTIQTVTDEDANSTKVLRLNVHDGNNIIDTFVEFDAEEAKQFSSIFGAMIKQL